MSSSEDGVLYSNFLDSPPASVKLEQLDAGYMVPNNSKGGVIAASSGPFTRVNGEFEATGSNSLGISLGRSSETKRSSRNSNNSRKRFESGGGLTTETLASNQQGSCGLLPPPPYDPNNNSNSRNNKPVDNDSPKNRVKRDVKLNCTTEPNDLFGEFQLLLICVACGFHGKIWGERKLNIGSYLKWPSGNSGCDCVRPHTLLVLPRITV